MRLFAVTWLASFATPCPSSSNTMISAFGAFSAICSDSSSGTLGSFRPWMIRRGGSDPARRSGSG